MNKMFHSRARTAQRCCRETDRVSKTTDIKTGFIFEKTVRCLNLAAQQIILDFWLDQR